MAKISLLIELERRRRNMGVIAGIYILCIILSITLFFVACNKFGIHEQNGNLKEYEMSIKLFKISLGAFILGFSFLALGLLIG